MVIRAQELKNSKPLAVATLLLPLSSHFSAPILPFTSLLCWSGHSPYPPFTISPDPNHHFLLLAPFLSEAMRGGGEPTVSPSPPSCKLRPRPKPHRSPKTKPMPKPPRSRRPDCSSLCDPPLTSGAGETNHRQSNRLAAALMRPRRLLLHTSPTSFLKTAPPPWPQPRAVATSSPAAAEHHLPQFGP